MMLYRYFTILCSLVMIVLLLSGCNYQTDTLDSLSLLDSIKRTVSTTGEKTESSVKTEQINVTSATDASSSVSMEIPFAVGATVRVYESWGTDSFSGEFIKSKAQLNQLQSDENYSIDKYTEEYFSDKVLLVLYITLESGSMRLQIDNAITSGNTLTIQYTTTRPKEITNDMAYWKVLLEINKSDIESISLITGERNRVYE